MKPQIRVHFDDAVAAKEAGDLARAELILSKIHIADPSSPAILAVLGDVYWEIEKLPDAVECFSKALKIKPNSEAISLGYFHCCWNLGRFDDAITELKRFLEENESDSYTKILSNLPV